jgi:predicted phosphodiesterase
MKLFAVSDIHGAIKPINKAATLIREADLVVISGDITHTKTRAEAADVIACFEQYSTRILAVHGNWDRVDVKEFLEEKTYSLHGKGRIRRGWVFANSFENAHDVHGKRNRSNSPDWVRASARRIKSCSDFTCPASWCP